MQSLYLHCFIGLAVEMALSDTRRRIVHFEDPIVGKGGEMVKHFSRISACVIGRKVYV